MRIWDLSDASCWMITIETPTTGSAVNQPQDAGVTSVSISPDGTMVAAGSLDSIIRIWEIASGTLLDSLQGHRDSVYSVAFTPDGKGIVSGSLDKSLKFWDLSSLLRKLAAGGKDPSLSGSSNGSRPSSSSTSSPVDYIGHKVSFPFFLSRLTFCAMWIAFFFFCFRTSCFRFRLRSIVDGWCQGLKIVVYIFGTPRRLLFSSFFKDIKILVGDRMWSVYRGLSDLENFFYTSYLYWR